MVLGPSLGTLAGTLTPTPLCASWAPVEDRSREPTRQHLAGCSASHYNCSAHTGGSLRGRSDHRPSAHTVGSHAQANISPPGTPAFARRPHGTGGVPSGSAV